MFVVPFMYFQVIRGYGKYPPGGKSVCIVRNLHLVYSLNMSGLSSPLVSVFSEPFLGFRVRVRKPYFGF